MTSSRRDVDQILYLLDDLATAMGEPFATDTRAAFRIIDAVERHCREHHRSTTDMGTRSDLKYRCSRCGAVFTTVTVADGAEAARSMLAIRRYEMRPDAYVADRVEHDCGNGEFGVAEYLGRDLTPGA